MNRSITKDSRAGHTQTNLTQAKWTQVTHTPEIQLTQPTQTQKQHIINDTVNIDSRKATNTEAYDCFNTDPSVTTETNSGDSSSTIITTDSNSVTDTDTKDNYVSAMAETDNSPSSETNAGPNWQGRKDPKELEYLSS